MATAVKEESPQEWTASHAFNAHTLPATKGGGEGEEGATHTGTPEAEKMAVDMGMNMRGPATDTERWRSPVKPSNQTESTSSTGRKSDEDDEDDEVMSWTSNSPNNQIESPPVSHRDSNGSTTTSVPGCGAATANLAKFKAAQDLKIQTENLSDAKPMTNVSSDPAGSSSCFTTPGADVSSVANTPKTPLPPSSTGKKRRRRTAAQIDRKYSCNYPGCTKAYGSEGSLTQHQRLKHRQQQPENATGAHANQMGNFFLPLHRPGRNMPGSVYRANPNTSRAVNIRPASIEGVMSQIPFDGMADMSSEFLSGEQFTTGHGAPQQRQNLRSRSNSMPVTFPSPPSSASKCNTSSNTTPRPQTSRKPRVTSTPRPKVGTARRVKCRSKSESLADMAPFLGLSDTKLLRRSDSSSGSLTESATTNSLHEPLMPLSCASNHSYDWSHSSVASDTPTSSNDQAIDSDILSVLADCDPTDIADPQSIDFGPPSTSSYRSHASYSESDDQEMLSAGMDCFQFSQEFANVGIMKEEEAYYQSLARSNLDFPNDLKQEWANNSRHDALFLSTHMEKMSMAQATSRSNNEIDAFENFVGAMTTQMLGEGDISMRGTGSGLDTFGSGLETLDGKITHDISPTGTSPQVHTSGNVGATPGQNNTNSLWHGSEVNPALDPTNAPSQSNSDLQMFWMKDFPTASCLPMTDTSNQYMEDNLPPQPTHDGLEWKLQKLPSSSAVSGVRGHGNVFNIEKHSGGTTASFSDRILFEDYGLDDTRMSSPLCNQREELYNMSERSDHPNSTNQQQQQSQVHVPLPPPATRTNTQQRLHISFQNDRQYLRQMVTQRQQERTDRIEAILELKHDLDGSVAKIQAQNAQMHARAKDLAASEAREYQELLNQGKNPHEVHRQRHVKQIAEQERKQLEQRIQDKQIQLLQRLEVEKVQMRRREKLQQDQLAFEKKYQQEMGRAAAEERTKAYLVSRTDKEQLDPTGKKFRIYPSQETTIKDHSFGLGRNLVHTSTQRREIVDKVHAKAAHHDAIANPLLLPRHKATVAAQMKAGLRLPAAPSSPIGPSPNNNNIDGGEGADSNSIGSKLSLERTPGLDMREVNHRYLETNGNGHEMTSLPTKSKQISTDNENQQKKGFGKPKRSNLEQQMLANAREKQKRNIFQKQIVWGKEFIGDAFLSDPPILWFKDFDVGVPQQLKLMLTNVSNTFNHFKLLDLPDEVRDCFEIVYEKPGRMSAGISCAIHMTFTAVQAIDIETELPVVAQTGPFRIPIKCTCKKAVPVLIHRAVHFADVVAGEKKTINIQLENHGALPFEYTIRPLVKYPMDTSPEEPALEEDVINDTNGEEMLDTLTLNGQGLNDVQDLEVSHATNNALSENDGDATDIVIDSSDLQEDAIDPTPVVEEVISDADNSGFLVEEDAIVRFAKSLMVYKPEGADQPLRFPKRGQVLPYSSTPLTFTFAPSAPMQLTDQQFLIDFTTCDNTNGNAKLDRQMQLHPLPSIPIVISAESTLVPIYVAREMLDFRCCVYGKLYRHQLLVCNRGKVALKIQIRVPKLLEDVVDFHPNVGFVQAATINASTIKEAEAGEFRIQVKFRPQQYVWKRLEKKGFGSQASGIMAVPVQIVVPDQVVPVFFLLVAQLTPGSLVFSSKQIDFGRCCLGNSVYHLLTVENTAKLPQRIGFKKLPPEIRIDDPTEGICVVLLPLEKRSFKIVYQPNAATNLQTKLVLCSSMNQEYVFPCTGMCVTTPLVFSHTFVQLGATQLGQSQTFSISCTNISDKVQQLELFPPIEAQKYLRVTPLVARINGRESIRIEIEFNPHEDLFEVSESLLESKSAFLPSDEDESSPKLSTTMPSTIEFMKSRDEPVKPIHSLGDVNSAFPSSLSEPLWKVGIPAEERSCHYKWTVLCFRRSESFTGSQLSPTTDNHTSSSDTTASSITPLQAFQVSTTVIEPKVFPSPSRLEFGQVAIGQTLVLKVTITNNSIVDVLFMAKPLHALGVFRVVNSSTRKISALGGTGVLKVEFRPQNALVYQDELELTSPTTVCTLKIPIRGEGINPSLVIHPANGILDFEDVLVGNKTTLELVLTNASTFPLTFAIVPYRSAKKNKMTMHNDEKHEQDEWSTRFPSTSTGLPVFTFAPSEATIAAQASVTVKVVFYADHQRPEHYTQRFRIQVPNESETHFVILTGRCWENQLYVFAPTAIEQPSSVLSSGDSDSDSGARITKDLMTMPPIVEDLFDIPPSIGISPLVAMMGQLPVTGLRKPASVITLCFDPEDERCVLSEGFYTQTVFIGSTMPPISEVLTGVIQETSGSSGSNNAAITKTGGGSIGTFELVMEDNAAHSKLFTIEPMKGAIAVSQQLAIQITYKPPMAEAGESMRQDLMVSQWIQVRVTCTLRGGFLWRNLRRTTPTIQSAGTSAPMNQQLPKPGASIVAATDSDAQVAQVILRAKLVT